MQSVKEVAQEHGCSDYTVRRYLRKGHVKAIRASNRLYLTEKEAQKVGERLRAHGGPGGRPLITPS
jgi:predicted site-specific integrase-resolvase